MKFFRQIPMNEAGEGAGGGGGAPAPAPAAPAAPAPDAPVTRAELGSMIGDAIAKALAAKQPEAPKPDPKPEPKPDQSMPEWAQGIVSQVQQLTQAQAQQQVAATKQRLMSTVLAGVPDAQRGTATLAVEGMLATTGVQLSPTTDVSALAQQLTATLRANHASLFIMPGSSRPAVQVGPDGKPDYSGTRSLGELTPEQIRQIPDADFDRLVRGGGTSHESGMVPQNLFLRR
jgi:hypothetical protein